MRQLLGVYRTSELREEALARLSKTARAGEHCARPDPPGSEGNDVLSDRRHSQREGEAPQVLAELPAILACATWRFSGSATKNRPSQEPSIWGEEPGTRS